VAVGRMFCLS